MKSIISGEPQTACYKSKDFVTFTPRTKLIFATNAQLSSGDTSDGLTRRLVLIDFKTQFVDNPDSGDPYQRQKNVDILDSLIVELNSGGIFNWAYEGYKLLRAVGYFTETHDQEQLMEEFKRASNPIMVFYDEIDLPDSITNGDLYGKYCQWCSDNGEKATTSVTFHREFKSLSRRLYQPYRTNSERGYRKVTDDVSPNGSCVTPCVTAENP